MAEFVASPDDQTRAQALSETLNATECVTIVAGIIANPNQICRRERASYAVGAARGAAWTVGQIAKASPTPENLTYAQMAENAARSVELLMSLLK
ncbi:hypothetical protein TCAL_15200 [Tigriopus californicus]|uniref:Uncharacterized protein n=1 Tax=Tigriopus californicus TaxID=6832 RepID=A0A553NBQ7_TIGCA|nr:hypothetical protein TCAL_15200 [Tigriopus californicus]